MTNVAPGRKSEGTIAQTQKVLGTIMGGLSIFALVAKTWEGGIAAPVELLVETYDALLDFFLGWAQPFLHALAETLSAWIGQDIRLYPHWKVSVVAYGILVGAGLSTWAEIKFPSVPRLAIAIFAGAAGIAVGLVDAMLQRDPRPDEAFYWLWQVFGQSYVLAVAFIVATALASAGIAFRLMKSTFVSPADADLFRAMGERTLGIYVGAAAFALMGAGGKLLGL